MPDKEDQVRALHFLQSLMQENSKVLCVVTEEIRFIDAGDGVENIYCPSCGAAIDMDWWISCTDQIYEKNAFSDLTMELPCCHRISSLNDLQYVSAVGFARFSLEIRNPTVFLNRETILRLEALLKCSIRKVHAHY